MTQFRAEVKWMSDQRDGDFWQARLLNPLGNNHFTSYGTGSTPEGAIEALKSKLRSRNEKATRIVTFEMDDVS